MKKAILLLRVSSEMQEEKNSLNAQEEQALKYCEYKKYKVHKILKDVESGWKEQEKRESLDTISYEASKKSFDVLIVYEFSRLSRDMATSFRIIKELEDKTISFESIMEPALNSDSEVASILRGVMAGLAEQESKKISKRVSERMKYYASQGKYLYGKPPFGYRKKEDKTLEVFPKEANIVKDMFRLFISGYTTSSIARNFEMNSATVTNILKNKVYIGMLSWGKDLYSGSYKKNEETIFFEGTHPPIVSDEDYMIVQILLDEKSNKMKLKSRQDEFILKGLLTCSCGSKLYGRTVKKNRYYCCSTRSKGIEKCGASYGGIKAETIEKEIIQSLSELAESGFKSLGSSDFKSKKELLKNLKNNNEKLKQMFMMDIIDLKELKKKSEKNNNKISQIEEEMQVEVQSKVQENKRGKLKYLLKHFDKLNNDEKREILNLVIHNIKVISKEELDVQLSLYN